MAAQAIRAVVQATRAVAQEVQVHLRALIRNAVSVEGQVSAHLAEEKVVLGKIPATIPAVAIEVGLAVARATETNVASTVAALAINKIILTV